MNKKRIAFTLFGLLLIGAGFAIGWFSRGVTTNDVTSAEQMAEFLHTNVSDGMSIDEIRNAFGINAPLVNDKYTFPTYLAPVTGLYRSRPAGYEESDTFCSYAFGDQLVLFQIRNGRLINFDSTDIFMLSGISA